jgi:hypothetical protein
MNLGFGDFKYYNFCRFFSQLLNGFGLQTGPLLLNVVLVGISFYTFSWPVIDIYLKIKAEYNF